MNIFHVGQGVSFSLWTLSHAHKDTDKHTHTHAHATRTHTHTLTHTIAHRNTHRNLHTDTHTHTHTHTHTYTPTYMFIDAYILLEIIHNIFKQDQARRTILVQRLHIRYCNDDLHKIMCLYVKLLYLTQDVSQFLFFSCNIKCDASTHAKITYIPDSLAQATVSP